VVGPRDPPGSGEPEAVPERVFRGEPWAEDLRGSSNHDRTPSQPEENWVDRVIVPMVTFLRPSRFGEPAYWRRYVPLVIFVSILLTVALALVVRFVVAGR
jgi:hypothetical protein